MKKLTAITLMMATTIGLGDFWCVECTDDRTACAHVQPAPMNWQYCRSKGLSTGCAYYEYQYEWCLLANPPVQDKVVRNTVNLAESCSIGSDCY